MRKYVLYSDEHLMFWNPDSAGYTRSFKNAGLYTEEEVTATVRGSGPEKKMVALEVTDLSYCKKMRPPRDHAIQCPHKWGDTDKRCICGVANA